MGLPPDHINVTVMIRDELLYQVAMFSVVDLVDTQPFVTLLTCCNTV